MKALGMIATAVILGSYLIAASCNPTQVQGRNPPSSFLRKRS